MRLPPFSHVATAMATTCACSVLPPPALPDPDIDLGLGDVVLLTWTTRSPDGILGHAMVPDLVGIDPHRKVVSGQAHWVETSQKMRFMFTRQQSAKGKIEAGMLAAEASATRVTHIAYDVHLTRYLELPPDALQYSPASGCCFGGEVADACGAWYVIRMMWGTGRVIYLQQIAADAGVTASEVLRAQGGTAYRRLNEVNFDQAFFAYEAVPLADLCAGVKPDQEIPTLAISAPKNCWALAQRKDGTSSAGAWHVSDRTACKNVVHHHCAQIDGMLSCHLTFGSGDDAQSAPVPIDELKRAEPISPGERPKTNGGESW